MELKEERSVRSLSEAIVLGCAAFALVIAAEMVVHLVAGTIRLGLALVG